MISNVIEKLGRAIFEAPFGAGRISKDAPELAEIRLAVLDAVKSKSHRAGGKHVFPFDLIRIHLRGVPEELFQMGIGSLWLGLRRFQSWSRSHFATDFSTQFIPGHSAARADSRKSADSLVRAGRAFHTKTRGLSAFPRQSSKRPRV